VSDVSVRGIELHEIETVLVLAEELHFGRTAERLSLSPARVTQTVQAVERRVGGRLFERTSRSVALSPLGESLVAELRPAFEALEQALVAARERARGVHGVLRIGHLATAENIAELTALTSAFEEQFPDCQALCLRFDIADYFESLRRGDVDVWLTWWPGPFPADRAGGGLRCASPIARRPRVLLLGRRHPLAERSSISLDDLLDHPLLKVPTEPPKVFRELWNPTTTRDGTLLKTADLDWHGLFQELARILERGEHGWLTHASILESVPMPPTVTTVLVRDADPLVLLPIWRSDGETAATRAFVDRIPPGV
jgi:DNA-binding transcriptional LysR family regulator